MTMLALYTPPLDIGTVILALMVIVPVMQIIVIPLIMLIVFSARKEKRMKNSPGARRQNERSGSKEGLDIVDIAIISSVMEDNNRKR